MEGFCDVCGVAFVDEDKVIHLSYSSWDEEMNCMTNDFDRMDLIVHDGECVKKVFA